MKTAKPATFGAFFRARRNALGLSLREFCRRSGLDAGNISRVERGRVPPPSSPEVLEDYAKALKLQDGSEEWQTFLDLAAAETGRVPADLAGKPSTVEELPSAFRALRGTPRQARVWTSAVEMENWASSRASQEDLPRLVRRLIHADNQSIEKIELAAGEGIARRGFDGVVVAAEGSLYVPQGTSVWEMGVGSDPPRKANEDYKKRTAKTPGIDKSEATFIFVTPRRWEEKEVWCEKKKQSGDWKYVKVYDADNLEAWLERAQGVDSWFARLIGRRPEGVIDVDEYWLNLSELTEPKLLPAVFRASRKEEDESIERWLKGEPSSLAFQANTPTEVIDFFAAYIASREEQVRESWAAKIVIVERREAWEALVDSPQKLVLVLKADVSLESEQVARAVREGHHVLVAANRFTGSGIDAEKLSRPIRHELEQALVDCGFEEPKAEQLAQECGGSLTVLKRRLSRYPGTCKPKWAEGDAGQKLAPFLLIGGWDDSSAGDRKIVEQLTGRSYADAMADVHQWAASEDAPFVRALSCWSLTSHEDAWHWLSPYLRVDQQDAFEAAALAVLGAEDPTLDLPTDERWMSGVRGERMSYSGSLRSGIAETLALLAIMSSDQINDTVAPASRADRVVRNLLKNKPNWKLWASLSPHLPVLAEASPEGFLEAVSADIRSESPELPKLFDEGAHPLFSRCLHAGLLWALETLAWSPKHLARANLALARLAELDTGKSQWSNRPQNSLAEIFLPWIPQTSANLEQRLAVLDKLRNKHPDVAWKLLRSLLPSLVMTSTPTPRPTWRDWALSWSRGATTAEYWQQIEACCGWLLEMAGSDADRWIDLIETISNFPESERKRLIEGLVALDPSVLKPDEQRRLSDTLREEVVRHVKYADADWVIAPEEIAWLKQALNCFTSMDPIVRDAWLFDQRPRLLDEDDDSYEEALARRRQQVLRELMSLKGLPLVVEFADAVRLPRAVGYELARAGLLASDEQIIPPMLDLSTSQTGAFARGYAAARFRAGGWNWVEKLPQSQWEPEQAASLLLTLPEERMTWEKAEKLGPAVCQLYWENLVIFTIRNNNDVPYVIQKLLQHGRRFTAVDLLASTQYQKYEPPPSLVLEVLFAHVGEEEDKEPKEGPREGMRHDLQQLIAYLQRPEVACDAEQLAALEWAYLAVLDGHGGRPVTLHDKMRKNPAFFAEVLALIFRSEHESEEPHGAFSDEEKARARNAYELLHSWNVLPGFDASTGTVDGAALENWVSEARRLCQESGRITACDSRIGEMLSHAPGEPDGPWPCIPVRDVIDEVDTEEVRNGFAIGVMNQRGVYTKSAFEGGKQERELAETYSKWAAVCDAEWPVTAAALRSVASHYEHSARREDEVAQSRRRR